MTFRLDSTVSDLSVGNCHVVDAQRLAPASPVPPHLPRQDLLLRAVQESAKLITLVNLTFGSICKENGKTRSFGTVSFRKMKSVAEVTPLS